MEEGCIKTLVHDLVSFGQGSDRVLTYGVQDYTVQHEVCLDRADHIHI